MATIDSTVSSLPLPPPESSLENRSANGAGRGQVQSGDPEHTRARRRKRPPKGKGKEKEEGSSLDHAEAGPSEASSSRHDQRPRPTGPQETESLPAHTPQEDRTGPSSSRRGRNRKEGRGGSRAARDKAPQRQQEWLPEGSHRLGEQPKGLIPNSHVQPQSSSGEQPATNDSGELPSASSSRPTPKPRRSRAAPPRAFGGELTEEVQEERPENGKLRADAKAFEPGKSVGDPRIPTGPRKNGSNPQPQSKPGTSRSKGGKAGLNQAQTNPDGDQNQAGQSQQSNTRHTNPRGNVRQSQNEANRVNRAVNGPEDIITRIHKELGNGSYECMVCYGGLTRKAKVWNCTCCWSVFHLNCIQKWAKQGLEQPPNRAIGPDGEPTRRNWRCPACNNTDVTVPDVYTCWCEKTIQPEISKYLPPHSCGQTCGKQRISPRKCPHACDLQCHAGPCPPCTAIGPQQTCFCGKETSQKRCIDTDYESGWGCGQVCGDFMPCGEHICEKLCHPGLCGACEVEEELKCFCGKETNAVKCCDKKLPVLSKVKDGAGAIEWLGHWDCGTKCDRPLDCSIHTCSKGCHPQDPLSAHCPLSPDIITHCPCEKTRLEDIITTTRKSCEDIIPTCDKVCDKILKCGHSCPKICHSGDCGICFKHAEVTCRCGRVTSRSMCNQGEKGELPQCPRNCKISLNCGRHECGEKCCPGEQKALERLSVKKKMRSFNQATTGVQTDDGFESEHICTRPCGRLLKCGTHNCPLLCHRGPCGTCLEASFDELTCHCGRTTAFPPIPCGTKPPPCSYQCTRRKQCSHPAVPHNCHTDEGSCPKCPYLTEKLCLCGKKAVKATPCWREVVSCGTECGKKLSCGSHTCHKVCHKNKDCEEPCKQQCGKSRPACLHPCIDSCHAPFQCSEDKPCTSKVQLACACGGLKQEVKCGSTKGNPLGNKKELKCTDQCRSRRLAMALELDPDREALPSYSDETIQLYMKDKKWSTAIEQKYRAFAEKPALKRLAFQPMRSSMRAFLHTLATDYGFDSESQDPEPYRSVVIHKGSNFTVPPRKTIAEFLGTKPAETTPASAPVALQQLKKPRKQPFNAIVLTGIRIGLLVSELERELEPVLTDSQLRFFINWSANDEVILEPKPSSFGTDQIELELTTLSSHLKRHVVSRGLAENVDLCCVGRDGQIANKEGHNWSIVAARTKPGPPPLLPQGGASSKNTFSMLVPGVGGNTGPSKVEARKSMENLIKKKREDEVVDDWEAAADDMASPTFERNDF